MNQITKLILNLRIKFCWLRNKWVYHKEIEAKLWIFWEKFANEKLNKKDNLIFAFFNLNLDHFISWTVEQLVSSFQQFGWLVVDK